MRKERKVISGITIALIAAGAIVDALDSESQCNGKTQWRDNDSVAYCVGDGSFNLSDRSGRFNLTFDGRSTGVIEVNGYLVVGNKKEDGAQTTTFIKKDGTSIFQTDMIKEPGQVFGIDGENIVFAVEENDGRTVSAVLKNLNFVTGEITEANIELTELARTFRYTGR